MKPGSARRETTPQSTLPKRQCAVPDANVVAISARWTVADAPAALIPRVSSSVVELTPYAMPSAPSISWAKKPISPKARILVIESGPTRSATDILLISIDLVEI